MFAVENYAAVRRFVFIEGNSRRRFGQDHVDLCDVAVRL